MILVDEDAPRTLIRSLEGLRANSGNENIQCLYLRLARRQERLPVLKLFLPEAARRILAAYEAVQLFICDDSDVFVLAASLDPKDARALVTETANILQIPANNDLYSLHDASFHTGQLIALLEEKIEKQRQELIAAEQRQAASSAAQKRDFILSFSSAVSPQEIARKRASRDAREILVIEDDPFSRRLVETSLNKQYRVTALGETETALKTYVTLAPDIVFLDINLPDVSGHDLLTKILSLDPAAFIVMLSGNSDRDNVMQAMSQGAKGFVAKPFTRDKLFHYIERAIAR